MAELLFNKSGVPLIGYGTRGVYLSTMGAPEEKPKKISSPQPADPDKTSLENYYISDWGSGNTFPTKSDEIINSVSVLNSGLKFIRNFTIGQGIFPVTVEGFDDNGNEVLKQVSDPKIRTFANSRMVRRYLEKATRDYLKFGPAFIQLLPNADGSQLVGINTINAKYCRLSIANANGVIEKCIVSGKWLDTPSSADYTIYDVLDEYDPEADLRRRQYGNKVKGKSFVQVIRDSWSNNEYYSSPVWYSSYTAGWIDIAKAIPAFLKQAYINQITWKWHVQIPYAFWDRKFPESEYPDVILRQQAINNFMDEIEDNLCGTSNANKPVFTMFEVGPNGRTEEQ